MTINRYSNQHGNSGVTAYEFGPDYIDVQFRNESRYRYDGQVPGPQHVETMKKLASQGQNLATYISQHVGQGYALRLR